MTKRNMTHKLVNFTKTENLRDYTLVIPSVSVGNVPQLTVDLLIATHDLEKVGILWHPAIIPSVGGDPYGADPREISTAADLYASDKLKLGVIQIRSGIEVKYALHFFQRLKEFILESGCKNVVVLASTFAYELHNVTSGHFRFVSNENIGERMKSLGITEMEKSDSGQYLLHGAGYASKLYEVLVNDVKSTVLVKYVSEGDNRPDAYLLLDVVYKTVDSFKNANVVNVKHPSSWQFVFGSPPPIGLY